MLLIADQSRMTAEMIARRLRVEGMQVEVLGDPGLVLTRAAAGDVRVALLDPKLPGTLEVVHQLRKDPFTREVAVVLFGASHRPDVIAAGLRAGAAAYLVKGQTRISELAATLWSHWVKEKPVKLVKAAPPVERSVRTYLLHIQPGSPDALRLCEDTGAAPGLRCPHCRNSLSLRLRRDLVDGLSQMTSDLTCAICARADARPRESHLVSMEAAS